MAQPQLGFLCLALSVSESLDEVSVHQLINCEIQPAVNKRGRGAVSEHKAIRNDATLPHSTVIKSGEESSDEV